MDWKSWVRTVAPALATALGSPAAGLATRLIAGAVLGKSSGTEAEIAAAVQGASPDKLLEYELQLKQADQQFAKDMAALELERDKLEEEDRTNARAREIAIRDWVTPTLALGVTAIWALTMAALFFLPIPQPNRDVLVQAVGNSVGLVGLVMGYYFGTSFGSRTKDATIGKALNDK